MDQWAAIRYRDFYDVPRIFLVSYDGRQLLFDCAFDEELDDYPNEYCVYLMPPLTEADLAGSWEQLPRMAKRFLGQVGINEVQFDSTKRNFINASAINQILSSRYSPVPQLFQKLLEAKTSR